MYTSIFSVLCVFRRGSEGGSALSLLVCMSQHQPCTGYFLLMYLLYTARYPVVVRICMYVVRMQYHHTFYMHVHSLNVSLPQCNKLPA